MKTGHAQKVQQIASLTAQSVGALLLYADAFAISGEIQMAEHYVSKVVHILNKYPNPAMLSALNTRLNRKNWHYYNAIVYHQKAVSDSVFKFLDVHTQARALRQAINRQNWDRLEGYARIVAQDTLSMLYFDTYNRTIQWLAYLGDYAIAAHLLEKVDSLPLRKRYRQRLEETRKWTNFEMDRSLLKKRNSIKLIEME